MADPGGLYWRASLFDNNLLTLGTIMNKHEEIMHALSELVARNTRIETRLTKYLGSIGFESGAQLPYWTDGAVRVLNPATSLSDILRVIPAGWLDEVDDVDVWHNEKLLATLTADRLDDANGIPGSVDL